MKYWLISIVTLQALDGLTTYRGLTSGIALEANPIASFIFDIMGLVPGLILGKAIAITSTAALMAPLESNFPRLSLIMKTATIALMLAVVINNLAVIL